MNTTVGPKASTAMKLSAETTNLRRRLARIDALFSEGLQRLQSDYHARVRQAARGEAEESTEAVEQASVPS
jgi:hypothetical protein